MPVPLVPYPTPLVPPAPPANGAQSQLVCSGCRNLLLYPVGATSVCCAVCNAVTAVPPPGTEMAQLICGGCHTLLMYIRGATSVQCSCCHTINLALEANQVAHVDCGNCRMLLMYQYGAQSVKCAVCNFVTSVGNSWSQNGNQHQLISLFKPSLRLSHNNFLLKRTPISCDQNLEGLNKH
ncbi:Protein lol1 [Sarracenia purpurea var. burkii]